MSSDQIQPQIQDETQLALVQSPHETEGKVKNRGGKGRRKIDIKYIEDKTRRQITFSKRKAGLMKKAYELSTLTGTQILVLVTSETGHVYTFATKKFQPFITDKQGKTLIQNCLSAPEIVDQSPDEVDALDAQDNSLVDEKDTKMGGQMFTDYQRYPNGMNSVLTRNINPSMGQYTQMFPQQMHNQQHLTGQYFQSMPMQQGGRQGNPNQMHHSSFYDQNQKDA